jgi:hypothetical protein
MAKRMCELSDYNTHKQKGYTHRKGNSPIAKEKAELALALALLVGEVIGNRALQHGLLNTRQLIVW